MRTELEGQTVLKGFEGAMAPLGGTFEERFPEEGLFGGEGVTPEGVRELYEKGRSFKESIDLYETVNTNENFFIGKQWEGVRSNGLPTPVFNILKRDVCFVVSSITSDNLKVQAEPLASTPRTEMLKEPVRILNEEFESLFEHNNVPGLLRELARDAAVRGDGCLYSWWDQDSGEGTVRSEIIPNTRVHFGNPNDRHVQSQPWIIIESREMVGALRKRAWELGSPDWDLITADDDNTHPGDERRTDGKVTKLLFLWREPESGEIRGYECAGNARVRGPWSLGIRLYPIVWLSWDYIPDCCHGQAMITGLIPNQIFINKMWAMSMLSLMTTAYPKIIYDRTRIPKWTNQVGQAIGVTGGDVSTAARPLSPAVISPQVTQFIDAAIDQTNRNLGTTSAALGDVRPDNTSAIIALQRAAATPSEITKQNLQQCVEELAKIYLEFIGEFYGIRPVDTGEGGAAEFDFGFFRGLPMALKIDVGASAYYSEIASVQTLDNLLSRGHIDMIQYLERIPDGYIADRRGLIEELKKAREDNNGK